ncbi:MAG: RNA methyltransferase [Candidatus Promineifilaceae bacterium]
MITSPTNAKVKYVRRLQSDRRFRMRENCFVVEGSRWLGDLAAMSHPCQLVLYTHSWRETEGNNDILQQLGAPSQAVSDEVMALMSDTVTPPGVLAVAQIVTRPFPPTPSFLLILDQITNPGNLGTMLRTAAAAGVEGVLLSPGCVDAYNPKVVRGSMGALLRLPVQTADWPQIANVTTKMEVWVATANGEKSYTAVNWQKPAALIIGNEANGPGPEAHHIATGTTAIPMHAATESLNAATAAAVILFEAARQRAAKS